MADEEELKEFPDVSQKLAAPKKLSAYEKEKQAAEAKRHRAEAENAAALKEFEQSFADDDAEEDELSQFAARGRGSFNASRSFPGPPNRYSTGSSRHGPSMPGQRSGPGSLGPVPGQPPSLKRKRALEEMREAQEARREQPGFGVHDASDEEQTSSQKQNHEDDHEEELPKPVVYLPTLPPNMTVEEIKTILGPHMRVHSVRLLPASNPTAGKKRSLYAVVTLMADMTSSQIDSAINALQDRYLSCGFSLSISRHQPSATLHPSLTGSRQAGHQEPFNARPARSKPHQSSLRNAPPPGDQRGFAPPDSYDRRPLQPRNLESEVDARPPADIATLRAVHTIADRLLSEPSFDRALEVEALLMSLPEVQNDERFAFLFDSRSPAGIYYRHCLWSHDSLDDNEKRSSKSERLISDIDISWQHSLQETPFADLTHLSNVVTDVDYASSDEESDQDDAQIRSNDGPDRIDGERKGKTFLSPLQRARLTHLLARLPAVNTKLRKGDVARVTNFAINHAGSGIDQIVDMLLLNIERPFCTTLAAKYENEDGTEENPSNEAEDDEYDPEQPLVDVEIEQDSTSPEQKTEEMREDPANAKLVALYIISDILSASSLAGARNAWKYRQLFEAGFKEQGTFQRLGSLDREYGWGKMKAEQWKRKMAALFEIWETWSAFSADVLQELKKAFYMDPSAAGTDNEEPAKEAEPQIQDQKPKWLSRFKKVETTSQNRASSKDNNDIQRDDARTTQEKGEELPAPRITSSNVPKNQEGDNTAIAQVTPATERAENTPNKKLDPSRQHGQESSSSPAAAASNKPVNAGPRKRMRAEDMFADSDED